METFLIAFFLLMLVTLGMSVGVIMMGRTIKGSCGGLNAISGADKCVVCSKDIDPDSPLRERLQCPRAKKMLEQMDVEKSTDA
ncbi:MULTISPECIES: (Na+)-NQR maturation NqrM [unclassified Shimia]|uniref:(Na+)-NQR maturation NqrM n=1 Tax=unclassified Shimia TaxID=2630038 RepID=UPI001ADD002C|nr:MULTISPECIES: (Na+)-NQR maturation NqrM [unclassified Shimia]MBO9474348.1 (Na+)-NQR maturation NqrM [Shimia sp. R10_1]MDA5557047.1 (Na+)-NQR maturation NqrM [Shimia sp. MMG029]